jgi:hypothetical protein
MSKVDFYEETNNTNPLKYSLTSYIGISKTVSLCREKNIL